MADYAHYFACRHFLRENTGIELFLLAMIHILVVANLSLGLGYALMSRIVKNYRTALTILPTMAMLEYMRVYKKSPFERAQNPELAAKREAGGMSVTEHGEGALPEDDPESSDEAVPSEPFYYYHRDS
ncbi:unnamed protein product [Bursaphelenchus xylophilus]|uniref:(pine wood nematode) hypothetical protein n=1 Tax=Bursaphelenchus xylophilus TaxID=6326 RepID=A0A1I7RXF3_BURXY|nr:unnamed protein product [Bursaphelenchus xylophilus]CAG9126356.1 unnamed protein product [Bursaphelenchus xylophilus]